MADVDVVNRALVLLATRKISALGTANDRETAATEVFESRVKALFAMHPWHFAMKTALLVDASSAPLTRWTYNYALPSDFLAGPWAAYAGTAIGSVSLPGDQWERNDQQIYSNEAVLYLKYTYRVATASWPEWFAWLVVYDMAAHLAEPLTDSTTKAAMWMEKCYGTPQEDGKGGWFRNCRQLDTQTGGVQVAANFPLLQARLGGASYFRH